MAKQVPRTLSRFIRCHHSATAPQDNYYKLLGVTESFHVDSSTLAERFKHLQRQWHPDRFVSKPQSVRQGAANMSARLNEAYSVLRVPYERAKHLLQIRTEHSQPHHHPIHDTQLDPDFLTWVVHIRETIAEAGGDQTKLATVKRTLEQTLEECLAHLSTAFENNQLKVAATETAKLQYLRRIEQAIDGSLTEPNPYTEKNRFT